MKIIYTIEEATEVLQDSNRSPNCRIEIEAPYHVVPDFPIHAILVEARRFDFKGNEKIAAIRAIREKAKNLGYNIPLVEAKNFVESI
jgi:hypothetical protein